MTDNTSADYTLRPSGLSQVLALLVETRQPTIVWGRPAPPRARSPNRSPRPRTASTWTFGRCCALVPPAKWRPGT